MTLTLALVFGLIIGVSLGALGGGGSILTVPALVYVLNLPARGATAASLIIVGITAMAGAFSHTRSGNVRWTTGIVFGLVGLAASFGGTALNRQVDPNVLLLCFAALMLVAATAMLRRASRDTSDPAGQDVDPSAGNTGAGTAGTTTALVNSTEQRRAITPQVVAKVVVAGLVVGFLTGFLGVGGGFVIVPALVVALDFPMPIAVGTSLLIIAINSGSSLLARAGTEKFDWSVIIPFTAAAIIGSLVGKQIADRASGANLSRAFAVLLIAVAIYVGIRSGIGLA